MVANDSPFATTDNLGFALAKASQWWNERLGHEFADAGFADVRPAFGSILLPLFEEDGQRMGQLAFSARLAKQTLTSLVLAAERHGLVERRPDEYDRRSVRVWLAPRGRAFQPVAESVLRQLDSELERSLGARNLRALVRTLHQLMDLPPRQVPHEGAET